MTKEEVGSRDESKKEEGMKEEEEEGGMEEERQRKEEKRRMGKGHFLKDLCPPVRRCTAEGSDQAY